VCKLAEVVDEIEFNDMSRESDGCLTEVKSASYTISRVRITIR